MANLIQFYRNLSLLILFTIGLGGNFVHGQDSPPAQKWAAQVNFQKQDLLVKIDLGQLGVLHEVRLRPRYSLDVQRVIHATGNEHVFLSAQLSYFHNLYHDRRLGLTVGAGYEMKIGRRFFASVRAELGVARVKGADIRYRYENGAWVTTPNTDKADLDVLFTPRADVGYRLVKGPLPVDLVANTNLILDINSRIGVAPYFATGLGVRLGF